MRWPKFLVRTTGGLVTAGAVLFGGLQTGPGQRALAGIVSWAASTPERPVEVSGIGGFFPTSLRVARIELTDRQGTWGRIENGAGCRSLGFPFCGRARGQAAGPPPPRKLPPPPPRSAPP